MRPEAIIDPLFSIVTVVLNNKEGLIRTAQSIERQNSSLYEWVVIDGGSTDGTLEVLEAYSKITSVKVSEPDKGIYDAMNKGLNLCTGSFVVFLNADDQLVSDALQSIFEMVPDISDLDVAMLFCEVNLLLPDGKVRHRSVLDPERHLWHRMPTSHQAIFFERQTHLRFQYSARFPVSADYATVAEIYAASVKERAALSLPIVVSETPIGGNSFSSSNWRKLLTDHWRIQTEILQVGLSWRLLSIARKLAITGYLRALSYVR
ncbi:hypothetical protein HYN69_18350 (plasmid) [Gemmobacter aquarius]|uniref:Glycosyltransferase 2-like domain-containing protein n=2 Tax=Paragemmobacter aquarius TaxID=2169400 RepID=A0A2S0URY7_9RHOB|nr:hypothetical protein HYN69_18350 [Gemmobacter aquarius]